jgi:hypothetical protein
MGGIDDEDRTVFGLQVFDGFVYSPGPHLKIALRPLDARMSLPAGINSYLFEKFSQFLCVEQAFGLSRQAILNNPQLQPSVSTIRSVVRPLAIGYFRLTIALTFINFQ